jgi:uncharacterized protein YbjT (DUF2867 family)
MSVFVVGASGNVGRRVVGALLRHGVEVAALVRDPDAEAPPGSPLRAAGVRLVPGDLRSPGALRVGAAGCDALFLVTPHSPDQVTLQNNAVDVAADIGARVVKVSSFGPAVRADSPVPGARRHWITQQYILRREVPFTILCPNYFMQVLVNRYSAEVRRRGVLLSPAGERGISMIDLGDVAEVAARVLTRTGHAGRTYILTGPAAPTYRQIADLLSRYTGRPIRYHDQSGPEFAAWMAGQQRQQWETDHAAAIFGLYRAGAGELVTDQVQDIIGRPPRTVEEFLAEHTHHFLRSPEMGTAA